MNAAQAQRTWQARLLSHYMNAFWNFQKSLDSGAPDSWKILAQGQKESTQQDKELRRTRNGKTMQSVKHLKTLPLKEI